jgi:hypothetical protein
MGTGAADGRHDEIPHPKPLDSRPDLRNDAEGFVPDNEILVSVGRLTILEGTQLGVGAADADLEHPDAKLRRLVERRCGVIDDTRRAVALRDGESFHPE